MAAVSIDVMNNDKPISNVGKTQGSSGRLVEFSINLPLVHPSPPPVPQASQRSPVRQGR